MEKKDSGGRPIIQVRNLSKVYVMGEEHVIALKNVNLSINKGEICCIFGTSGSGKSTLLNQLAGLEKPTRCKNPQSICRRNPKYDKTYHCAADLLCHECRPHHCIEQRRCGRLRFP